MVEKVVEVDVFVEVAFDDEVVPGEVPLFVLPDVAVWGIEADVDLVVEAVVTVEPLVEVAEVVTDATIDVAVEAEFPVVVDPPGDVAVETEFPEVVCPPIDVVEEAEFPEVVDPPNDVVVDVVLPELVDAPVGFVAEGELPEVVDPPVDEDWLPTVDEEVDPFPVSVEPPVEPAEGLDPGLTEVVPAKLLLVWVVDDPVIAQTFWIDPIINPRLNGLKINLTYPMWLW